MNSVKTAVATETLNIAIADDDKEWLALFSQAVDELGLDINLFFVTDGLQLLRLFDEAAETETKIDLAVLDLRMPRLDGHGVLKQMEHLGLIDEIPVVVFTFANSSDDKFDALMRGALSYESKPTEYAQFLEFVASLPERARAGVNYVYTVDL